MVEVPDKLQCLFAGSIEQQGDSYRIEIPSDEIEKGKLMSGETCQVAVCSQPEQLEQRPVGTSDRGSGQQMDDEKRDSSPPVEAGELLSVEIETLGDQGDGIAKIDQGYVVIVPGGQPGDEVTVEVETARETVAFAEIRQGERVD